MDDTATRRRLLAAIATSGLAGTGLAGCLTGDDGTTVTDDAEEGDAEEGDPSTAGTDATTTAADGETAGDDGGTADAGGESTATGATGDLDLREANVTGVELDDQGGGDVRFSVTLYHDDDGEHGYANWWVVETRDGEELGRRELLHAHGTREFTRSETVSIPSDVECVVVRGHDRTHGYGGQAAIVSVASGAVGFVDQGAERSSFADVDCP
jgi:hypothetical protein